MQKASFKPYELLPAKGVGAGKKKSQQMRERGGRRTQRTSRETMREENFSSAK